MTSSGASLANTEDGRQDISSAPPHCTMSLIQAWERREDIQSTQPHVDVTDAWSSDGGSVSSSSCSSDQPGSGQEDVHETDPRANDQSGSNAFFEEKIQTNASCLK
ncbi:unnamed protein product [Echinostoma caproni]|uniref:Uncharacterized protein n=1 Tax=Echinostoma caproni TaxID=27848 RepID=A0A183AUN1_9TREM|nr:unnamed protein product [Echinostoma caproni]